MNRNAAALLTLAWAICGCAGPSVLFGTARESEPRAEDAPVLRVYFDRFGAVYPPPSAGIKIHDACLRENGENLASARSCMDPSTASAEWEALQAQWFSTLAAEIRNQAAIASAGASPVIFVLIHGFNVKDAEPPFEAARAQLMARWKAEAKDCAPACPPGRLVSRREAKPLFVEVHWDGRVGSAPFFRSWGPAQHTGPLVGLSLRRLLADPGADVRLRVLTHSSGAFVIGATIGNSAAVLPCAAPAKRNTPDCTGYERFAEDALATTGRYRLPKLRDVRVAMLAPATPPGTFAHVCKKGQHSAAARNQGVRTPDTHLAWSLNSADFALGKVLIPSTWSAFGATSLGQHCRSSTRLAERLRTNEFVRDARVVSFERSVNNRRTLLFWDSHDFTAYLERDAMPLMIDFLFGAPLPPQERETACPIAVRWKPPLL